MLELGSVNWLAVLVALLAHMVVGMAWFGAFAGPWARLAHPGKTQDDIRAGPKWVYAVALGGGLVTAVVLGATLQAVGAEDLLDALAVAFLLWLGFVLAKYATTYAFEYRSWTLLAIDAGYPLVSMLVMAAVFAFLP